MPLFWFFTGALTTLAAIVVLLPWLRKAPRFAALPVFPWHVSAAAGVALTALLAYGLLMHPGVPTGTAQTAADVPANASKPFTAAAKVFADSTAAGAAGEPTKAAAGSMNSAITNLESRLAKGGGSDGDWELLAKSFEFLGRPADAAKARAHQLPPVPKDDDAGLASSTPIASPAASGVASSAAAGSAATAVSGEIILAPALKAKAAAGETLFIVAKSVDAPGAPVAVFRGSVGNWPVKFKLDDSQSMLPGRNLSTAGRVTIEARISLKGQPLPATGDLQGSSGVVNPADHQPLKITIDRVIS